MSVCSETRKRTKSTLLRSLPRRVQGKRYRSPEQGSLGGNHISQARWGAMLVVKSAKSKSESTFLSKVTHVSLKANSSGQLSCQLSPDKEGRVCTQVPEPFCTTFFWFPLRHPFIESLKEGEGEFQVRACLARPRKIQSQKNTEIPSPASLPSLVGMWPRKDAGLCMVD